MYHVLRVILDKAKSRISSLNDKPKENIQNKVYKDKRMKIQENM